MPGARWRHTRRDRRDDIRTFRRVAPVRADAGRTAGLAGGVRRRPGHRDSRHHRGRRPGDVAGRDRRAARRPRDHLRDLQRRGGVPRRGARPRLARDRGRRVHRGRARADQAPAPQPRPDRPRHRPDLGGPGPGGADRRLLRRRHPDGDRLVDLLRRHQPDRRDRRHLGADRVHHHAGRPDGHLVHRHGGHGDVRRVRVQARGQGRPSRRPGTSSVPGQRAREASADSAADSASSSRKFTG